MKLTIERLEDVTKKYDITVIEQDNKEGLKLQKNTKNITPGELEEIKENKQEIIDYIISKEIERKTYWAKVNAEQKAKKEAELEALRPLQRLAIVYSGWYLSEERICLVAPLLDGKNMANAKRYYTGGSNCVFHQLIEEKYGRKEIREAVKALGFEFESAGELNYGESNIFYITEEQFEAIQTWIANKNDEKARAKKEQKAKEKAEFEDKFEKAKTTGQKVEIESYTIDCNDKNEECDTDIVTVWAMPDGSTTTTRQHTW